ncbi:MAG: tetratricopeptide repeat protein [Methylophilaceae bacterium]
MKKQMHNLFVLNSRLKTFLSLLILLLPAISLYATFLSNPLVFDDLAFFDKSVHAHYLDKIFSFSLRWLPYASLEWTQHLVGANMLWYRLGNLALHLATTVTLFFFLHRLFDLMLPELINNKAKLSNHWLAFFAALIFSLHPASVYAVGYLIERSILMATLFALLTWLLFLQGLVKNNKVLLMGSCVTYLLAVLSKEHAIMVPAVAAMLVLLVKGSPKLCWFGFGCLSEKNQLNMAWLKPIWLAFILYALVGLFVVYQVKLGGVLGQAYEPNASNLIARLGLEPHLAYSLSLIMQTEMFFKYLWLWLLPNPASMSIDMHPAFALHLWSWSNMLWLFGFIIYPFIALRLLFKKGAVGLLGFALLCPWLLFATEFGAVRIQEPFVIYRSYLWMPCLFAVLPYIFQKFSAKVASYTLITIAIIAFALSWVNLVTFSQGILLWDDAVMLAEKNGENAPGNERMYYNLGNAYKRLKSDQGAIKYYNQAIKIGGPKAPLTSAAYQNIARIYFYAGHYPKANEFFKKTLALDPKNKHAIDGLADSLKAIKKQNGVD